ncbi:MAG TPA: DUF1080 domain-containing protein [Gemmata sp.]|nr:DUF1080 domain-containing protein [Gemmata sp.]
MLRLLSFCATFILATSACADDKPKPNTLTQKEIADGWILLFDGESTYGWSSEKNSEDKKAELTAKNGTLSMAGKGQYVSFGTRFQYFELNGEYRTSTKENGISIASEILIAPQLKRTEGGVWKKIHARMTAEKGAQKATVWTEDYDKITPVQIQGDHWVWVIKCHLSQEEESQLELRNLKLRPLETKPLFNGKDLDGWSVNKADPKRMASKWEATKEGELSLKNGPGDLVSEKEFDNFVLQVECKTLGEALNSGVFFRNMPGQYQNGYEAQIQNSYKVGDRTKPIDFGTGAIYRRIPARKVVSNDNEWFTMTVVAEGKHITTWVNGYQTVDWTDDRPADENPRKGYRSAKGPLSLQGHDKTTDLLFRNIRIAELPVEKMPVEKK